MYRCGKQYVQVWGNGTMTVCTGVGKQYVQVWGNGTMTVCTDVGETVL